MLAEDLLSVFCSLFPECFTDPLSLEAPFAAALWNLVTFVVLCFDSFIMIQGISTGSCTVVTMRLILLYLQE